MRRAPLQLDLVAPPRRSRWLGYLVLAGSLLVANEMFMRMREAQDQVARLDAVQGLLGEARPTRALSRERLEEQMKEAQAVLQVQPDAQQRLLRVTAEAKGEDIMFRYLRRLAAAEGFSDVHLVSHQVREDDPRRPLQFALQVSFRSPP